MNHECINLFNEELKSLLELDVGDALCLPEINYCRRRFLVSAGAFYARWGMTKDYPIDIYVCPERNVSVKVRC